MSKVDPTSLKNLDRKSTLLLQASRSHTEKSDQNDITAVEEPGMDALRGSFGAFGSVIRARTMRTGNSTGGGSQRHGYLRHGRSRDEEEGGSNELTTRGLSNIPRHQLYDAPVPRPSSSLPGVPEDDGTSYESSTVGGATTKAAPPATSPRNPTIRFEATDVAHFYPSTPGKGGAIHEQRHSTMSMSTQPGSQVPEYSDNEDEAFDPGALPLAHTRGASDRILHKTSTSDPFRDGVSSASSSQANLINPTASVDSGIQNSYSDREGASSPEETRRPFHSRSKAYPGRTSSSDEEDMAGESLVAHDSGSTRGGIRLIPTKSPRKV